MKEILVLFINFFKIGLFTFGGGYAMIPHIKDLCVEKKKWLTDEEMIEMIAVAEATPGPIAVNMATFIGYKRKGILGGIITTLGVILPSFIIIFVISLFFDKFLSLTYVKYAFEGIKCAVAFLICKAGIDLFKKINKNALSISLFVITFLSMIAFDLFSISFSSIFIILLGGILGLTIYTNIDKKKERGNKE